MLLKHSQKLWELSSLGASTCLRYLTASKYCKPSPCVTGFDIPGIPGSCTMQRNLLQRFNITAAAAAASGGRHPPSLQRISTQSNSSHCSNEGSLLSRTSLPFPDCIVPCNILPSPLCGKKGMMQLPPSCLQPAIQRESPRPHPCGHSMMLFRSSSVLLLGCFVASAQFNTCS